MLVNILGVEYIINEKTHLDLSRKKLTEIPDNVFELVNLKTLDLSQNELTYISSDITKLANLQALYLNSNRLTDIFVLPELVNLKDLNLSYNGLIYISDLSKLVNLEYLYLDHNKLTSIPCELCEMKKLRYVNLSSNCIHDDDSIKIFENLTIQTKYMSNQKQQSMEMLILPMVII